MLSCSRQSSFKKRIRRKPQDIGIGLEVGSAAFLRCAWRSSSGALYPSLLHGHVINICVMSLKIIYLWTKWGVYILCFSFLAESKFIILESHGCIADRCRTWYLNLRSKPWKGLNIPLKVWRRRSSFGSHYEGWQRLLFSLDEAVALNAKIGDSSFDNIPLTAQKNTSDELEQWESYVWRSIGTCQWGLWLGATHVDLGVFNCAC